MEGRLDPPTASEALVRIGGKGTCRAASKGHRAPTPLPSPSTSPCTCTSASYLSGSPARRRPGKGRSTERRARYREKEAAWRRAAALSCFDQQTRASAVKGDRTPGCTRPVSALTSGVHCMFHVKHCHGRSDRGRRRPWGSRADLDGSSRTHVASCGRSGLREGSSSARPGSSPGFPGAWSARIFTGAAPVLWPHPTEPQLACHGSSPLRIRRAASGRRRRP